MADIASGIGSVATLAPSGTTFGDLEIGGDQDWYRITLTAGYTYDFRLSALMAEPVFMQIDIRDSFGQSLDYDQDGDLVSWTATETGTYFVSVADSYNSAIAEGGYAISARVNDDVKSGMSTTAAITATGSITRTLGQSNDSDWFRLTLAADRTYAFALQAAAGPSADMEIALYDSLGERLTYDVDGDVIDWTPETAGTFYLVVRDTYSEDASEGQYTINALMNDDFANSDATTASLQTGTRTAMLGQSNDRDWFRVTLAADRSYDFGLTAAAGSGADMEIALYDASGARLTYDRDGGRINWSTAQAGTYYVVVSDSYAEDAAEGRYTIDARMTDDVANSAATGAVLAASGMRAASLAQSNDTDWFRVSLTAGMTYGFGLTGDGSATSVDDGRIRIVNSSGAVMDTSYVGGVATLLPAQGGTYYVVVDDYNADDEAEGSYRIQAMMSDSIAGNASSTASLAANGNAMSSINAPYDTDWFRLSLRAGLTYGFTIAGRGDAAHPDPDLYLRDADGAILEYGANSSAPNVTLNWTAQTGGLYFLQAGNIDDDDTGAYVVRSIATDTLRNDRLTTGAVLEGERISGRIDVAEDSDWLRVNLVAGRDYTLSLARGGTASDLSNRILRLLDDDGAQMSVTYGYDATNATIRFTPTRTGAYFLEVEGNGADDGNFTLTLGSNALRFTGSAANNSLIGNGLANVMLGMGGSDALSGLGGNDTLWGGAGHDRLFGGTGADRLMGEAGNDVLDGQAGTDILDGGLGQDQLIFRRGGDADTIRGFADDVDTLRLLGLGVSTVTQAMARAVQLGTQVVFDFGQGDRLVVEDMTLAALRDDLAFV